MYKENLRIMEIKKSKEVEYASIPADILVNI